MYIQYILMDLIFDLLDYKYIIYVIYQLGGPYW